MHALGYVRTDCTIDTWWSRCIKSKARRAKANKSAIADFPTGFHAHIIWLLVAFNDWLIFRPHMDRGTNSLSLAESSDNYLGTYHVRRTLTPAKIYCPCSLASLDIQKFLSR